MNGSKPRSPTEIVADYMSELLDPAAATTDSAAAETSPGESAHSETGYYMCYLFGLEIGIPADRICADAPMPATTRGVGSAGVLTAERSGGQTFTLIDLAPLILPPDMPNLEIPVDERADHVILVDEGEWAIVAESPSEFVDVAEEQVIWKGPSGRLPWLAGVIPDRRSVLIDLDGLLQMAESSRTSS
jgi:hypothetical protein